jgi:hypothetical protein
MYSCDCVMDTDKIILRHVYSKQGPDFDDMTFFLLVSYVMPLNI